MYNMESADTSLESEKWVSRMWRDYGREPPHEEAAPKKLPQLDLVPVGKNAAIGQSSRMFLLLPQEDEDVGDASIAAGRNVVRLERGGGGAATWSNNNRAGGTSDVGGKNANKPRKMTPRLDLSVRIHTCLTRRGCSEAGQIATHLRNGFKRLLFASSERIYRRPFVKILGAPVADTNYHRAGGTTDLLQDEKSERQPVQTAEIPSRRVIFYHIPFSRNRTGIGEKEIVLCSDGSKRTMNYLSGASMMKQLDAAYNATAEWDYLQEETPLRRISSNSTIQDEPSEDHGLVQDSNNSNTTFSSAINMMLLLPSSTSSPSTSPPSRIMPNDHEHYVADKASSYPGASNVSRMSNSTEDTNNSLEDAYAPTTTSTSTEKFFTSRDEASTDSDTEEDEALMPEPLRSLRDATSPSSPMENRALQECHVQEQPSTTKAPSNEEDEPEKNEEDQTVFHRYVRDETYFDVMVNLDSDLLVGKEYFVDLARQFYRQKELFPETFAAERKKDEEWRAQMHMEALQERAKEERIVAEIAAAQQALEKQQKRQEENARLVRKTQQEKIKQARARLREEQSASERSPVVSGGLLPGGFVVGSKDGVKKDGVKTTPTAEERKPPSTEKQRAARAPNGRRQLAALEDEAVEHQSRDDMLHHGTSPVPADSADLESTVAQEHDQGEHEHELRWKNNETENRWKYREMLRAVNAAHVYNGTIFSTYVSSTHGIFGGASYAFDIRAYELCIRASLNLKYSKNWVTRLDYLHERWVKKRLAMKRRVPLRLRTRTPPGSKPTLPWDSAMMERCDEARVHLHGARNRSSGAHASWAYHVYSKDSLHPENEERPVDFQGADWFNIALSVEPVEQIQ
ncbi:unnamed protein product [Amoebophrya sp. A25]|nr:unnamed protein product [Amoebophrya sp. A25]|eukprot:GSA25T00011604001.1